MGRIIMSSLRKKFGKRIKELRKLKGLTQEQIAELINIEPPNISKIESGTHFPQPENIEKIAKVLELNIKELFDFEHFNEKPILLGKINAFLNNAEIRDLEFIYKLIISLESYKQYKKR